MDSVIARARLVGTARKAAESHTATLITVAIFGLFLFRIHTLGGVATARAIISYTTVPSFVLLTLDSFIPLLAVGASITLLHVSPALKRAEIAILALTITVF